MHAYRFRLLAEDQDEFLRDIDILANQTFEEFHRALIAMFKLDSEELASFYICDNKWRRIKELTLIDMEHDEDFDDEDEDEKPVKKNKLPVFVMNQVKIRDIIDDPHQRMVYEYDFLNPVVFYIELYKIVPGDKEQEYPLCSRSVGEFVRAPLRKRFALEDLGEDLLTTEDDMLDDMFEVNTDEGSVEEPTEW
ncbi:MAG: hypothetical protein IH597_14495 [Bacteroidales bacterium]|nr:hypothetical protein [Bacteroidales bacterium]